ncbi:unnamed protein product [Caenorhabditis angaria]|uniref:Uncharacterized protein n=1 Tax=Caenorhabditis angaria TaxID=860376 RepID=A0A9P1J0R1_9PELO|nr:unnamed protein product [Caenorhabditis angaria]
MAEWLKSVGTVVSYFFSGDNSTTKKVEVPQKPKEDETEENDFGFEHLDLEERMEQKRKLEQERKQREELARQDFTRRLRFEFKPRLDNNN